MRPHVRNQTAGIREGLVALLAFVRLLPAAERGNLLRNRPVGAKGIVFFLLRIKTFLLRFFFYGYGMEPLFWNWIHLKKLSFVTF